MKKIKLIILSILLLLLFCIIFFFVRLNKFDFNSVVDTHIFNKNLVYSLSIDGFVCPYDRKNNLFYYTSKSVPNNFVFGSSYNIKYSVYYSDENLYKIIVYDDEYYDLISIYIDSIPIVNIYNMDMVKPHFETNNISQYGINALEDVESSNYVGVQITNLNHDISYNAFSSLGQMSIRGASSTFFDKKSYKLSFENKFGYDNVLKDDVWVLDALYTDASNIRNKLSSDLWNLINDNQIVNNDLHGEFVEVFIDNEYMGLYVLKEKVDKSVYSCSGNELLLKATSHLLSNRINSFLSSPKIVDDQILNFEIKKKNDVILNDFIADMRYFYSSNYNYDIISDIYNIDNYINYKIFVSLLSGEDNVTSNQYYSICDRDSKILITPWDMDLTWGLYWNLNMPLHSFYVADRNFSYQWMNENITKDMDNKTLSLLKKRYWELRHDVITMDTINSFLDSYKDLLISSGAASRDSERWYDYDIENEIENIRQWAYRRIQFLDDYFS